jgi:PleD family two-component response regulator
MSEQAPRSPLAVIATPGLWTARSLDSILTPHGYVVLTFRSGGEALEQMRHLQPDLLLINEVLGDTSGVELCRRLRAFGGVGPTTPILLTTQQPFTREARLEALRAGAWDSIAFPLDAEELLLKLKVYVAAKLAADSLREANLLDAETGLYNARGLLHRAREMSAYAARHAHALACVTVAPDPEAGSGRWPVRPSRRVVLRQLGELLGSQTRKADTVGRIGEDEFIVLAPETDTQGALGLAGRLLQVVESTHLPDSRRPLTLRAGCYAVANCRDAALEPAELLVRATLALRQAQAEPGAARIQLFQPEVSAAG